LIKQLAKQKTVILTTHDMDEADRLSDRIAILDHGKILSIDTPERLKEKSGMGDIVQIKVNGVKEDETDKLLISIPPKFTDKKYSDGLLLLGGNDVLELIPIVNKIIQDFGIHIEDITIRKRTLEDAFIAMTGRATRAKASGIGRCALR
jgi:ABC-2 type transport system ATP-binding protein